MKLAAVAVVAFLLVALVSGARDLACSLPAVTGYCRGYFPMFSFNPQTGQCEEFVWGGCGGNPNRFDTAEQCEDACAEREVAGCLYDGNEYNVGDSFKLDCNNCYCSGENEAACTRMGCPH